MVCCPWGVRFLSSILTSEVNAGRLQICVLTCQVVVKIPVGSQHLSRCLPKGLTMSAVIVQEGLTLAVHQNYIQSICLFISSVTCCTLDEDTSKNTDICVNSLSLCVSLSASLATPLFQRHDDDCLAPPLLPFRGEMRKLGKHWWPLGVRVEYEQRMCILQREKWPVPADNVAAPSAVLGGWPLTSYTALGTKKFPPPPHPHPRGC